MIKHVRTLAFAAVASSFPAISQAAVITDLGSEVTIDPFGNITVWRTEPDGSDNVFISSYYFRQEGAPQERLFIDAFGDPVVSQPSDNALSLAFSDSAFSATLDYSVTGGGVGSNTSTLRRSATLENISNEIVTFTLFDYTDFDILFNPTDQRDQSTLTEPGRIETLSASSILQIITQVTPVPDEYQITDFLTLLFAFRTDDGVTTLDNTPAQGTPFPTPAGDNAFAFGWRVILEPGQSFTATQTSVLSPVPVPPAAPVFLLGLGGLAWARRKLGA